MTNAELERLEMIVRQVRKGCPSCGRALGALHPVKDCYHHCEEPLCPRHGDPRDTSVGEHPTRFECVTATLPLGI